jgi:hypothetical protein
MPDINEPDLLEQEMPETNPADAPDLGFREAPQPGTYTFLLPSKEKLLGVRKLPDGKEEPVIDTYQTTKGPRLKVEFKGDASLGLYNGNLEPVPFPYRISNEERHFGEMVVSDWLFLLKALGEDQPLRTLRDYKEALLSHAGEKFKADVDWQARCRRDVEIRGEDGKPIAGKKGCGREYRNYLPKKQRKDKDGRPVETFLIPRADGRFAERFVCKCGVAHLRAFPQLSRYQSA